MIRRLLPFFLAIVAPLMGVALAFHFGTIDLALPVLSGTKAVPRLAALPPVSNDAPELAAEPEARPPAWLADADAADRYVRGLDPSAVAPAAAATPSAAPSATSPPLISSPVAPASAPVAEPPAPPKAHNPNVRAATLGVTVCRPGYTKAIRASFAARYRAMMLASAAVPPGEWHHWQLDHRVPLALGGSAREPANMVLQPLHEAQRKNRLEVKLQCLVCTGQVPLHVARRQIAGDWQAAYRRYAKVKCKRPRANRPRDRPA